MPLFIIDMLQYGLKVPAPQEWKFWVAIASQFIGYISYQWSKHLEDKRWKK